MNFKANGKEYPISKLVRTQVKPDWQVMLNPAKSRILKPALFESLPSLTKAERLLDTIGENLINKSILEIGCGYGERCFLMAKYEGNRVHGIDVDEYTANQSPDLNDWNPKDIELVHNKLDIIHKEIADKLPKCISDKVTFETVGIDKYVTPNQHDLIISFDVLEHIIDLPMAFNQMANALKKGGIAYHEYNPFFSITGGHSLCTLDFLYGHCILSSKDFERYVREIRPEEEKIDLNFYHKCLNRATMEDMKRLSKQYGFEVLQLTGHVSFEEDSGEWKKDLETKVLPTVKEHYPTVTIDDLMCNSVNLILRKI